MLGDGHAPRKKNIPICRFPQGGIPSGSQTWRAACSCGMLRDCCHLGTPKLDGQLGILCFQKDILLGSSTFFFFFPGRPPSHSTRTSHRQPLFIAARRLSAFNDSACRQRLGLSFLVGGCATPLTNMSASVGMRIPNRWKKCSEPATSCLFIF